MPTPTPLRDYRSYKGLPQLAGLCTVEEAAKPGLSVEECVRRLKRFHYCFKRLHQIHRLNNEECEFCAKYLDGDA